jgi:hypothetical protein
MTQPHTRITRELDSRTGDGIEVQLLWWCQTDGHVTVAITDTKTGEAFELPVGEGERALDVFHHPYAYAARPKRGLSRSRPPIRRSDACNTPTSKLLPLEVR